MLPKNVADRLRHQIAYVPAGIEDIIESLCQVDSEQAKAWKLEDEIKVKLANIEAFFWSYILIETQ